MLVVDEAEQCWHFCDYQMMTVLIRIDINYYLLVVICVLQEDVVEFLQELLPVLQLKSSLGKWMELIMCLNMPWSVVGSTEQHNFSIRS